MAQITLNSSGVASSGSLLLQSNGTTTAVTIDTAQNLGLGVTPSAWGNTYKAFQAGTTGVIAGIASQTDNFVFHSYANAFNDNTNWKYIASQEAGRYELARNVHKWFNAPSGTAGNAITFTQAMTLSASGNLGIGTTSPSARLDVTESSIAIRMGDISAAPVSQTAVYVGTSTSGLTGVNGDLVLIPRTSTTGSVVFYTGNGTATEKARIDSSGLFKIGTTSQLSAALLSVSGTQNGVTARVSVNSNSTFVGENASGTVTYNLTGSGQINAVFTSITAISDARLKTNIQTIKYGLDAVTALKPVMFDFIENDLVEGQSDNLGFIAQDVQSVIPELVSVGINKAEDGSPYLTLKMGDMLPVLVKAIQELKAEFDAYKASHP
jgi:hypothetical protein